MNYDRDTYSTIRYSEPNDEARAEERESDRYILCYIYIKNGAHMTDSPRQS